MNALQTHLDTRTLAVVAIGVTLVPAVVGALVWQTRRAFQGRWALGNLLAALAILLLSLRDQVPDWISIVTANTFVLGAAVAYLQGIRRFRGLPLLWWPECLLGGVAVAAIVWFRYVTNNINLRILAIGLALGAIGIACGVTLLKQMPRGRRAGLIVTGAAFTLGGIVNLARGAYIFVFAPVSSLFDPSSANALLFLGASLGVVTWSFGFILLTADPLEVAYPRPSAEPVPEPAPPSSARDLPKTIPEAEIHRQLQRILDSEFFRRSTRMERFLRFAVERTLDGHAGELKEYTLGREVFSRGDTYDPRVDSIVRVEAQRLRRKLREYYASHGSGDPVVIKFPAGAYVPVFEYRQSEITGSMRASSG